MAWSFGDASDDFLAHSNPGVFGTQTKEIFAKEVGSTPLGHARVKMSWRKVFQKV
jgi:hypothetical protein